MAPSRRQSSRLEMMKEGGHLLFLHLRIASGHRLLLGLECWPHWKGHFPLLHLVPHLHCIRILDRGAWSGRQLLIVCWDPRASLFSATVAISGLFALRPQLCECLCADIYTLYFIHHHWIPPMLACSCTIHCPQSCSAAGIVNQTSSRTWTAPQVKTGGNRVC